ncbi:MAG: phenylacetate--CoA ligase family protein [Hyphomicrobiales bacterium]
MSGEHFDELETRSPEQREEELFSGLPAQIWHATENAPGWAAHLEGVDPNAVTSREALAALPVLRKPELKDHQTQNPPFGGFAACAPGEAGRLFMSPGPVYEMLGDQPGDARGARSLYAAGLRPGNVVHNAFAYHLTPGGFMLDTACRALGCAVIPAGVGNTELQLDMIDHLKPDAYAGTPDFLKVLLDKGDEAGKDMSSIARGVVSGAALPESLRAELKGRGVAVTQTYATAELGIVSYETSALEGMVIEEGLILEIVRPGTGEPVAEGEVGEIVVTSFSKTYPMIRFGTGDLTAILPGASPCGRTNLRIKGWMGRADQRTKVKGMFIDPAQINDIAKRHPEIGRLRLVVSRENEQDVMTLKAESAARDDVLAQSLEGTVHTVCKVRGAVELVDPGSLPNDGKVIADERDYG